MQNEMWKPIKKFEDYHVSNFGNVKRLASWDYRGVFRKERIISASLNGKTYKFVSVRLQVDDRFFNRRLHKIVAEAFISNPDNLTHVGHIDGNPANCHVDNLEWITYEESLVRSGSKHVHAKLSNEDVIKIRQLYEEGINQKDIGKMYSVSHSTIHLIIHGKIWKRVK